MADQQATRPISLEGGAERPPEFDRVADVLGPLEQIVQAADQKLASIQEQVAAQAGDASTEVERKIQAAAIEQRGRVADLRKELTDRVTELAGRFDTLLSVLDDVDRELATTAGEVRVTMTEQQTAEIPAKAEPPAGPPQVQPTSATAPPAPAGAPAEPKKEKEEKLSDKSPILRFLRRSRRSKEKGSS
jgi:hypothetical protein